MDHDPVQLEAVFEGAGIDRESLTVLLVAGGSVREVLAVLGANPGATTEPRPDEDGIDFSAYAVTEVDGGVLAIEHTGYADPSTRALAELSALGGAAAVVRGNVQAHERFGCARDGTLLFDADEFTFVEEREKEALPARLRPLFDSAWIDLDDVVDDSNGPEGFVACAMATLHTGVGITRRDLLRAVAAGYHRVPSLTYLD